MKWLVIEYDTDAIDQIEGLHRVTGPFDTPEEAEKYSERWKCHGFIALEAPVSD